jgi:MFS family permease
MQVQNPKIQETLTQNWLNTTVIVAALGYFVDIYDLILFGIVRTPSLQALGYTGSEVTAQGVFLFNMQMGGMLLGGIIWGILGDKYGRLTVLFGSICMYSLANILNGFVADFGSQGIAIYAVLRLVAGIGLAGELGAGITLVNETMTPEKRGIGTMVVVTFGALGAVCAALIGDFFSWQVSYFIGGGLGLGLLAMRVGMYESGMYADVRHRAKKAGVRTGNFFYLLSSKKQIIKYLSCILVGLPIWFIVGILIVLSPELSAAIGTTAPIKVSSAVLFCYVGLSVGDLLSGLLSQYFKSRRKVIFYYILASISSVVWYLSSSDVSPAIFYTMCFALGCGTGYWALFATMASEQYGTNIRATVTTTAPNFVRGMVIPMTLLYQYLGKNNPPQAAAAVVGAGVFVLALVALALLQDTFAKDLDYTEE